MTVFMAGIAVFLIALAIGAALADWLDDDRRDARRRNDQARRIR